MAGTFTAEVNAAIIAMTAIAAGGAVSLQYTFSTTTTDADPGAGTVRLDNATQNTATTIRADLAGADGSDLSGVLALFDDSTSTNKGYLTIRHSTTPTKWIIFTVASVASPSGYKNITVTPVASSAANPFTNGDAVLLDFTPTGDKGDIGATGTGITPQAVGFTLAGGTTSKTLTVDVDLTASAVAQQGLQTCFLPAGGMKSRTTNGAASGTVETATNKVMLQTLDFDAATQEYAQFGIWMPASWNESTFTFAAEWSHAATTTNFGVAWSLAAVSIGDGVSFDAARGTAVVVTDTGGNTDYGYPTAVSAAITVAGSPTNRQWVVFEISRVVANAGDTMAIDARLHGIQLFYSTDAATDA
jgi:hypothetical protein